MHSLCHRAYNNYLVEINSKYPKSKQLQFIKRINWILPCIVKGMPFPGTPTFYTDANKLGMACFKSEKKNKQSNSNPLYSCSENRVLCHSMALLDFPELFNISTDSQYAESCSAYRNC